MATTPTSCSIDCTLTTAKETSTCSYAATIPTLPQDAPDIDLPSAKTVTEENVVTGKGVFDVYMRAGSNQLQTQYDAGRIKGADFAQAFVAMQQLMMTEANKFVLGLVQAEVAAAMMPYQYMGAGYDAGLKEQQMKETQAKTDLLCQQIAELSANGAVERRLKKSQVQTQTKQAELYQRQKEGFGEKTAIDAAKIAFDAWAVHAVEEPISTTYGSVFMNPGLTTGTTTANSPAKVVTDLMKKA